MSYKPLPMAAKKSAASKAPQVKLAEKIAKKLVAIDGVVAVTLGGSWARGKAATNITLRAFAPEGILVALDGCGIVEVPGCDPVALAKGDAVVVPASLREFRVCPQWNVEFLRAAVPGDNLPEPQTRL